MDIIDIYYQKLKQGLYIRDLYIEIINEFCLGSINDDGYYCRDGQPLDLETAKQVENELYALGMAYHRYINNDNIEKPINIITITRVLNKYNQQ